MFGGYDLKSNIKGKVWVSIISGVLFLLLIVIIKNVDVAVIGPESTEIGLSHINQAVHEAIGVNMACYKFTEITGILMLGVVAAFGVVGLVQLIRRKNLLKVDREILILGGFYIIIGILYLFFNKVAVNYRPIIIPGESEVASAFPSSHTVLSLTVMGSAIMLLGKYIKNPTWCSILKILCVLLMVATVVGRLLSGAHWLTDIIGSLLLSTCLLSAFSAAISFPISYRGTDP